MKEDIIKILLEYRDRIHGGNTDQAAKSLGVHPPTLWRWLNGKNIPKVESISRAFDMLNARIVLPGKHVSLPIQHSQGQETDVESLRKENEVLKKRIVALLEEKSVLQAKLIDIYEAESGNKNKP